MKVIDLFVKIANEEETPNVFAFANQIFKKQKYGDYVDENGDNLFDSVFSDFSNINDEIEIIEETEDEPIEKIKLQFQDNRSQEEINEYLRCSINELVEEINKLKKVGSK